MNRMTIVGNLTADPTVQSTKAGTAVAHFTVASAPRRFDRETGTWVEGDTVFLRCNAWGSTGENVAAGLVKGSRVLVTGQLIQRSFDDKDGNARTVTELDVEEIGTTLRFSTAAPAPTRAPALEPAVL